MTVAAAVEPRRVCLRCRRPECACYCSHLCRIETRTRVFLLQHPRERDVAFGTARMANLCLPNSELHVGDACRSSPPLERALSDPTRPPVLLYPGDGAADVWRDPPRGPVTLIVVDGTWANTRKMVRRSALLRDLPRLAFAPPRPSDYRIRREPHPHCVSTVEALAYVLGALEGDPERFERLLVPFRKMVDGQIEHLRAHDTLRLRRRPARVSRRSEALDLLRMRARDVVCVVGEANAWPYRSGGMRAAHPDELVHWVARRVRTGETFDYVAVPRNPVSPSTLHHLDLARETLELGGAYDTFLSAWREFLCDTDVLCSWGMYATSLLRKSGGVLPEVRFDLRRLAKQVMKHKVGSMQDVFEEGDRSSENSTSGRAGRRLDQLVRIAEWLIGETSHEPVS